MFANEPNNMVLASRACLSALINIRCKNNRGSEISGSSESTWSIGIAGA